MGSLFKRCACPRQARCPHNDTVRYRDQTGRQREESGYTTQQTARDRLIDLSVAKRGAPAVTLEERCRLGRMTFAEYAENWRTWQRHIADYSTGKKYRSHLRTHLYPALGDVRLETISPLRIERSIADMQHRNIEPGTQHNAYSLLRAILLDAVRKKAIPWDPRPGSKRAPTRSP